jgi:hypothetical protein
MEKKTVFKKILKLQSEIKGLETDTQGHGYSYLSGSKILGVVRPLMDEIGLLLLPEIVESTHERIDYETRSGNKSEMFTTLKLKFTWIDTETGDSYSQLWSQNAMNGWDKGTGSALTYAERYFLMKTLHIQTDSDDIEKIAREILDNKPASSESIKALKFQLSKKKIDEKLVEQMLDSYGKKKIEDMTEANIEDALKKLKKIK